MTPTGRYRARLGLRPPRPSSSRAESPRTRAQLRAAYNQALAELKRQHERPHFQHPDQRHMENLVAALVHAAGGSITIDTFIVNHLELIQVHDAASLQVTFRTSTPGAEARQRSSRRERRVEQGIVS